ncbi:hypothetical protein NKI77_27145, partial [Mesorhizobium opportunistum]|uniref:hypothetical protein n=1 Tax=Mesorhizobium opportunistum TaxID=593909 RepID=UPI0033362DDA
MRGVPGNTNAPLERQRLTPLEHPSSVSALRADPPSPTRASVRTHLLRALIKREEATPENGLKRLNR